MAHCEPEESQKQLREVPQLLAFEGSRPGAGSAAFGNGCHFWERPLMRGRQDLETLRLEGYAPLWVDLCAYPCRKDLLGVIGATAAIEALTVPSRAELRCLVGLHVAVHGSDAGLVHALREACVTAGARRVVATVYSGEQECDLDSYQPLEITDTEGVLTWPN